MKPVIVTTTIARPREPIYDFLAQLSNHEAFTDHFLVDWRLEDEGRRAVTRVKAPGPAQQGEFVIAETERPSRIVEHASGAGGKRRSVGTWTLTEEHGGGRTRVEFATTFETLPVGDRLAGPLSRAWLRKQNARSLERLREIMERPEPDGRLPAA